MTRAAAASDENRSACVSCVHGSLGGYTLETATSMPIGSCSSMMVMSWLNRFKIDPLSVAEKND